MKKLKKLNLEPVADWEKERLSRWLYEWELMQSPDSADELAAQDEKSLEMLPKGSIAPTDDNIEVGQIHLLAPVANENMLFIVITSIAENGDIGFVPFSPMSEPATADELLSGRTTEVIRVYSLWNLREVSPDIVGKSWIVDLLDKSEMERLLRALAALECDGCSLPNDLLEDAGAPVVHPEDPRREYKTYERQRIDMTVANSSAISEQTILYDPDIKQEFLKAAESPESYET